jgi:hypothetical protein
MQNPTIQPLRQRQTGTSKILHECPLAEVQIVKRKNAWPSCPAHIGNPLDMVRIRKNLPHKDVKNRSKGRETLFPCAELLPYETCPFAMNERIYQLLRISTSRVYKLQVTLEYVNICHNQ